MKTHFNVDANRIYMSGFSSGGGVAATVAAKYPHIFADSRLATVMRTSFLIAVSRFSKGKMFPRIRAGVLIPASLS